jgi:hypothetical protein
MLLVDAVRSPLFITIGFHSGDARLSRRCIRVHTDKHFRLTADWPEAAGHFEPCFAPLCRVPDYSGRAGLRAVRR